MHKDIILVGSVPLDNAEEVFQSVGPTFGDRIRAIPDGETGPRLNWIEWQAPVFEQHPAFGVDETLPDWRNADATGKWKAKPWYSVRAGVDPRSLTFGPLGYSKTAIDSFAIFKRCKAAGVVHRSCKFQISLPTPYNVIDQRIAPKDRLAVEKPYARRMRAEIAEICEALPHHEIAIQWDVAHEVQNLDGGRPHWFEDPENQVVARLTDLSESVPADVELGLHFCYGDFGHRHFIEPKNMGLMVRLANALARSVKRGIAWVHMPVPRSRSDDGYFQPLADLKSKPDTGLYLGLVHFTDGIEGAKSRISAARRVMPDFGVATECGFGRRDAGTTRDLLRLHVAVADLVKNGW